MKKLFPNYNFEFAPNEKKILKTFCKQVMKQLEGNNQQYPVYKSFNSILEKLEADSDVVKLTKDEKFKLKESLVANTAFLKKQSAKGWFLKKWLYKGMLNQYEGILANHFKD